MSALVECIAAFRNGTPSETELEMRMGTFDGTRFRAGVSREVFTQLERDMEDAPTLTADRHYAEMIDYHYKTRDETSVRTRVEFDASRMELSRTHISKQAQSSLIARRADDDDAQLSEVCRISHAVEVPLRECPTGLHVPTHVRVKQRRCFRDVRDGHVVWSYELSRTWSASSRDAVEHLQHMSEPIYEVECELIDAGRAYLTSHTDEEVAESLLLKASLLLGEEGPLEVSGGSGSLPPSKRGKRRRQNG